MMNLQAIPCGRRIGHRRFGIALFFFCLSLCREPKAQSFWQPANGPYGGAVTAFAINSAGHIFAGTAEGGIFRSTNSGQNWVAVNTDLTDQHIQSLAISPPSDIYALTQRGEVFQSVNNGESWARVDGLLGIYVLALAINDSGHVFVGTNLGILRSTDGGKSWTVIYADSTFSYVTSLTIDPFGNIFAGVSDGLEARHLLVSTNNGEEWRLQSDLDDLRPEIGIGLLPGISRLAIHPNGYMFAIVGDQLARSMDSGRRWAWVNPAGFTNRPVLALDINSKGNILVGADGEGVFRSADGGNSWDKVNNGLTDSKVLSLFSDSGGNFLAGTEGAGVFQSIDGGDHWTLLNTGLTNAGILSLAIPPGRDGQIFAGTDVAGVFRSSDRGASWIQINNGLKNRHVQTLVIHFNGEIWAGTSGGVFVTTNNGETWIERNAGLTNTEVMSLAINTQGNIFAGTAGGVFRSLDNGKNWAPVNAGLTTRDIRSLAINANGVVWAGTNGGGVFRSTNDGGNWTPVNFGLTTHDVSSLAINANGVVWAGTNGGGVFRSTNDGGNWTPVNFGLLDTTVLSLVINSTGTIFAGTLDGVFNSTNNGERWSKIDTGLANRAIFSLAIDGDGNLWAGTKFGGIFLGYSPQVEHTPPVFQDAGQTISVLAKVAAAAAGVDSVRLSYRRGGDVDFVAESIAGIGDLYEGIIPAEAVTALGVEYFIVATNSFGLGKRVPPTGIHSIRVRVPEPGVVKTSPQPYGAEQSAYRLISAPLDLDDKSPKAVLENDLGSYDRKRWRFFEFDESREYPNTAPMAPGKAFWLIVKDSLKVIDTGSGLSNLTSQPYPIALNPGWNYVGNPFNFPAHAVDTLNNGKPLRLYSYRRTWSDPQNPESIPMEPFEGYAVFNDSAAAVFMYVNPSKSPGTRFLPKARMAKYEEEALWSIRIIAQCQEARDENNIAAVAAGAWRGKDNRDHPEPPAVGEYVSVCFPHPEWAAPAGKALSQHYCTDIRPAPAEGEVWEFEVTTNIRDKVGLTFEGLAKVPQELEAWLGDEALNITQSLRESNKYTLAALSSGHAKRLKLVVGRPNFVAEQLATLKVLPGTYELAQNFPNPFYGAASIHPSDNPVTTIRYGLPRDEKVTVEVYNLLGEKVATLLDDEPQAAGYRVTFWDGRNRDGRRAASGIYLYRLRADRITITKKLLLLK